MTDTASISPWQALANRVLDGYRLTASEGLAILACDDAQLLDLLAAAYRVRYRWFGNRVYLNFLINAKSGLCSEDCGYCSQSRVAQSGVPRYRLVDADELLAGAQAAADRQAGTYCIVTSGRSPSAKELDVITQTVAQIKSRFDLRICVSTGLLQAEQARRLKQCGVDRVNHNLNTSRQFYPRICSTHTYEDRLATLETIRAAGLEMCCGGIVGMGESDADVVDMALRVGELQAESVPVNFHIPIPGTPLADGGKLLAPALPVDAASATGDRRTGRRPSSADELRSSAAPASINPRYCLKVLALFRLANPRCELRIGAGRELHLGSLQPLGLYPASSIFVGDYLTTKGQTPEEDYRMIEALGFEAVVDGAVGVEH